MTALPRTDPLEDRNAWGQGQGPRTQAQVLSKKKVFRKIFYAISRKNRGALQTFNNSKNIAVLEPRTGQFPRTWRFEAKAKDLTFEAKDIKMCPRGMDVLEDSTYAATHSVVNKVDLWLILSSSQQVRYCRIGSYLSCRQHGKCKLLSSV